MTGRPGRRLVVEADGGSRGNPGPAGYGAVVRDADTGEVLQELAGGIGRATNNVAEYEGLLAGLRAAADLDPTEVQVRMDSKLVVEQMSGRWQVKHPDMRVLARRAAELVQRLPQVTFRHVPRAQNAYADRLANEAMDAAARGQAWRRTPPAAAVEPEQPTPPAAAVEPQRASGSARPAVPDARGEPPAGWVETLAPPTVTVLLRHASTPLTAERRFSGTGDPDLSPLGVRQAEAAAERLAGEPGFAAVVSSPLRRARRTAEVVADRLELDVVVDDGLRETDFGAWEGCTLAEVRERWPAELDAWYASIDTAPPGGESFATVAKRVRRSRDRLVSAYGGVRLLVVSHVTPIKTLVRLALDAPPSALYRMHLDPVGISEIDWHADGPAVLRRLNDTAHLSRA